MPRMARWKYGEEKKMMGFKYVINIEHKLYENAKHRMNLNSVEEWDM
jgi:hypothetical protein